MCFVSTEKFCFPIRLQNTEFNILTSFCQTSIMQHTMISINEENLVQFDLTAGVDSHDCMREGSGGWRVMPGSDQVASQELQKNSEAVNHFLHVLVKYSN